MTKANLFRLLFLHTFISIHAVHLLAITKKKKNTIIKPGKKELKQIFQLKNLNSHFENLLKAFEFDKIHKSHLKVRLLNKLTDCFKDQIEIKLKQINRG